jgi:molybdopterin molybdotransferase
MRRLITAEELTSPLVPLAEAIALARQHVRTLDSEMVAVSNAFGRSLAETVVSPLDVPPFDNSAMDGYAVNADQFNAPGTSLDAAQRIATGAPLPDGCDSVIPWEDTNDQDGRVTTTKPVQTGQHVRARGAEMHKAHAALNTGTVLRSSHLGLLHSLGIEKVSAVRRPSVAIAATGNELTAPGLPLEPGHIYSSNHTVLQNIALDAGVTVSRVDMLKDEPTLIETWMLEAAHQNDLVITTGGASVGERDWTRAALEKLGIVYFWHVDIKPGKPVAFGNVDGTPVVVLPGNPGAVFVCSQLFVVPALLQMQGRDPEERWFSAPLLAAAQGDQKRNVLQPAVRHATGIAPLHAGSSQLLSPFLETDCLAVVPAGGAAAGDEVTVIALTG